PHVCLAVACRQGLDAVWGIAADRVVSPWDRQGHGIGRDPRCGVSLVPGYMPCESLKVSRRQRPEHGHRRYGVSGEVRDQVPGEEALPGGAVRAVNRVCFRGPWSLNVDVEMFLSCRYPDVQGV